MKDNSIQYNKINNICLIILTIIALTIALIYTKSILLPFIISLFVYAVISPLSDWLQNKINVPRIISVTITFLGFALILATVVILLSNSLEDFVRSADIYKEKVVAILEWTEKTSQKLGFDLGSKNILSELKELPMFSIAKNLTGGIVSLLSNSLLISIFTLFLITGKNTGNNNKLLQEVQKKVSNYVATKVATSVATGLLIGLILVFCGVELALMFAILTILLNFIPSIGSIIATVLPLPVLFLQFGLSWKFYFVLTISLAIQFIIGNVLEPKLMGESMDLHPITILIFLMFWGLVWGVPGMFLAVPITAIIKIILSRIETTKPMAELLAGRLPS